MGLLRAKEDKILLIENSGWNQQGCKFFCAPLFLGIYWAGAQVTSEGPGQESRADRTNLHLLGLNASALMLQAAKQSKVRQTKAELVVCFDRQESEGTREERGNIATAFALRLPSQHALCQRAPSQRAISLVEQASQLLPPRNNKSARDNSISAVFL